MTTMGLSCNRRRQCPVLPHVKSCVGWSFDSPGSLEPFDANEGPP